MRETAYLLDCYPNITEQFIKREIIALRASGVRVRIFARRADRQGADREVDYYSHAALLWELPALLFLLMVNIQSVMSFYRRRRAHFSRAYLLITILRAYWLIRRLNRYGIQHVHAHFLGLPAWLAYAVNRLSPTTYSLSAHAKDVVQPDLPLPGLVLSSADKLFFCTEYMRSLFLQKHPELRIKTVFMPHGLDLATIPATTPEKTRDIIAIGRLIPKKGFLYLLQGIQKVTADRPYLRITIFGEGPQYGTLLRFIKRNGLTDYVQIRPFVSQREVQTEISRSRILVHCGVIDPAGDSDGLPNIIPEALALGVPVLANKHPALMDVFTSGQQMLLTDATSPQIFAADMLRMLRDESLRNRISACGRNWVREHFDSTINIRPLRDFLHSAAGPAKRKLLYGLEATVGGTQKHLRLLTDALHKDYEIHLFVSPLRHAGFSADLAHYKELGVTVVEHPMLRRIAPTSDCKAVMALSGYLCRNRMDILHFHSSKAGGVGRLAAWLCGYRKVLYSPHAPAFLGSSRIRRWLFLALERMLGRITNVQIAVSESEKEQLVKSGIAPADKIVVAANALPSEERAPRMITEIRTVGFIGRLEQQKNPFLFLQASLQYLKQHPQIKIRIAGSGSLLQALRKRVAQAGVEEEVGFCGYLENTDEFYNSVDLLVLPSLWEGNPYTIWEAIAAGVPVVASDIYVHREILGSDYPYFFRSGDTDDVLRILNRLDHDLPLDSGSLFKDASSRNRFHKQISSLQDVYSNPWT